MPLLPWRKKQSPTPLDKSKLHPADVELADAMELNGLQAGIELAMRKSMAYTNYQAVSDADDQGNYFGKEFDIRSTAGRIKALYGSEPWIYTCAQLLARVISDIPLKVRLKGKEKDVPEDHPLNQAVNGGGVYQDANSLDWVTILDLVLGGNAFLIFNEDYKEKANVPVDYVQLSFNDVTRAVDAIQIYAANREVYQTREVKMEYVVHFKMPNPYSPFYGFPAFAAAARPILLDRYKNEFEMAFYLRGATNSGVIESTEDLSKSRMRRLIATFEAAFTGKRNWWRTLFLPKGAVWKNSSHSMKDMDHLEGLKENRKTILSVLGIPPAMVGLTEDVNRATSEQQERAFYQNTILPMVGFVCSAWNNSYLFKTVYKDQFEVYPDLSAIESLQVAMISRGEQAKAIESYFLIDEIRQKIFREDPLPDGKGQKFVAEIKSTGVPGQGQLALSASPVQVQEPVVETVKTPDDIPDPQAGFSQRKADATTSQNRLERNLGAQYEVTLQAYFGRLFSDARAAIESKTDVRKYLKSKAHTREQAYEKESVPVLEKAMDRGFSFANAQVKFTPSRWIKADQFPAYTEADRQAIDVLKERTADGARQTLKSRAIDNFVGFDESATENIMTVIEQGMVAGESWDQIAQGLESKYNEQYSGQFQTIVRTEVLSAASQGMDWNHQVLGQVFSKVNKQWLHQGDAGINKDAREEHVEFEGRGEIGSNETWKADDGSELRYPRDPGATAGQIINCRCTMVSVIPDDATSNASVILDSDR